MPKVNWGWLLVGALLGYIFAPMLLGMVAGMKRKREPAEKRAT